MAKLNRQQLKEFKTWIFKEKLQAWERGFEEGLERGQTIKGNLINKFDSIIGEIGIEARAKRLFMTYEEVEADKESWNRDR